MATADQREGATRLVLRHLSEYVLDRGQRWGELVPYGHIAYTIAHVTLSAGMAHLPFRDPDSGGWIGIDRAGALGRPVNALSVAESLGLPYTTVRRHAADCVAAGLLERASSGVRVTPGFFAGEVARRVFAEDAAALGRMVAVLAADGYAPAATAAAAGFGRVPDVVVERLVLAMVLRYMEDCVELYGDVVNAHIYSAIVAANVRHITADPLLSRRYGRPDTPPPDEERRPLALRQLARETGCAFETTRRRVQTLIQRDLVEARGNGVVVPTRVVTGERYLRTAARELAHFDQLLVALTTLEGQAKDGVQRSCGPRASAPTAC